MKNTAYLLLLALAFCFSSCYTSHTTCVNNENSILEQYKHVVFTPDSAELELADIVMYVHNEMANIVSVVTEDKIASLLQDSNKVAYATVCASTEKWPGGHTFITIVFRDVNATTPMAVVKSSGIGVSIKNDQNIAKRAISRELRKAFGIAPVYSQPESWSTSEYD